MLRSSGIKENALKNQFPANPTSTKNKDNSSMENSQLKNYIDKNSDKFTDSGHFEGKLRDSLIHIDNGASKPS